MRHDTSSHAWARSRTGSSSTRSPATDTCTTPVGCRAPHHRDQLGQAVGGEDLLDRRDARRPAPRAPRRAPRRTARRPTARRARPPPRRRTPSRRRRPRAHRRNGRGTPTSTPRERSSASAATSDSRRCASSRSGTSPPNTPATWARIEPPRRSRPAPRSTSTSAEPVVQLRGPRAADVGQRRERRHHQRHRRRHLPRLARRRVGPAGAHRERVLADRHRHPELGQQLHRHGLDGVVERGVLAVLAAGGHPVAGQLDARQRRDRRGQQVGQRLADRHPTGCRCVDRGERHPFAGGHRLAGEPDVVGQGDRDVGDRHLPRPDHLVAVGQPTDGAVGDRHEEPLGGDGRVAEHGVRGRRAGRARRGRATPPSRSTRVTSRVIRGGLPSSTSIGMSMARSSSSRSSGPSPSTSRPSSRATPTTA